MDSAFADRTLTPPHSLFISLALSLSPTLLLCLYMCLQDKKKLKRWRVGKEGGAESDGRKEKSEAQGLKTYSKASSNPTQEG